MSEAGEVPEVPTPLLAPRHYRIDSTRVTLREFLFGASLIQALLGYLLGLLRVRLPSSTDDPAVHDLSLFRVEWEGIPEAFRGAMHPKLTELQALGFFPYMCHFIHDPLHLTKTALVSLRHPLGNVLARVHLREWSFRVPSRTVVFVEFLSSFPYGTYLWSLSKKRDMLEPVDDHVEPRSNDRPDRDRRS